MRALITGITGFAGSHLADYLLALGHEVHGMYRWRSRTDYVEHLLPNKISLHTADLHDISSLRNVLEQVQPDAIFHLAAQSSVKESWNSPVDTTMTNYVGTLNLLEAIRQLKLKCPLQVCGSSEEYGLVYPEEIPIKETNPLRPLSPYAVSKVACDLLARQYYYSYKIPTVVTRAFDHAGPRRGEVFVTSALARQVIEAEMGKTDILLVGDLTPFREFNDVRDVVRAYYLAATEGVPGEVYNICSGIAYSIQQVLDKMLELSGVKVQVKQDPARMRPSDVKLLIGDHSKFSKQTGWCRGYSFEQTIGDLLEYWRERLKK